MTPSARGAASRHLLGIHAVREALRAGTPLQWIAVDRTRNDARLQELVELARARGVPVRRDVRAALDRWGGGERHQGVVAAAAATRPVSLDELIAEGATGPAGSGLLVALDGIEDPQNVGAVIRAAAGAGVGAVLTPERRAAGVSATVERVSAGALEHVRWVRVGNLAQALERLKEAGYWIVGLAADAPNVYWNHDFRLPAVLVIGSEHRGLHALIRQRCDFLLSIPLAPGIESLNAASAAAIALFEARRQRAVSA